MAARLIKESCCWVLIYVATLAFTRLVEATVQCVGGCNEVKAQYMKLTKNGKTTECVAYNALPHAVKLVQVQTDLGGTPMKKDGNLTRMWYCNDCLEVCDPPLDPTSRELDWPSNLQGKCDPDDDTMRRYQCVKQGSGS